LAGAGRTWTARRGKADVQFVSNPFGDATLILNSPQW
jgi:hypothetical protein